MEMHAVEGKLSQYYNHFEDYIFDSCEATDTRLMGVVALRVTWHAKDNPRAFYYQIIHLDYSEYGIDDYFEFDCTPNATTYIENREAMKFHWQSMTSVMGGKTVNISASNMMGLIDAALPYADESRYREYDDEENVQFRRDAIVRLELMKEALADSEIIIRPLSSNDIISAVVPHKLTAAETINYFLMRMVDLDFEAASYLSTIPEDKLRDCDITAPGMQTLMRNTIRISKDETDIPSDGKSHPYRCSMTTLGAMSYYYITLVIYLDGDYRQRDAKVSEVSVGSVEKLSRYEAAVQLSRHEYITVFDCRDRLLNNFDGDKFPFLSGVNPQQVANGWLYTVYNKDNSHVNSSDYRLSDDIYGCALLSIDGEFILMSNKMANINFMDNSTILSLYSPFMKLVGRYELDTPIFQNLCNSYGVMFRQLIEQPEYGD